MSMPRLISKLIKHHSKATRMAPVYSPVLGQIRGIDHRACLKQQSLF